MTCDGEAGSISGQVFPDKDFRTNISGQVFPDKPAGSCTTHKESFISRMIREGRRASFRVWDHGIPNPWRYNLTIVKKLGNKKYKAYGGKMPYRNGITEKSAGNYQRIVLRT